MAERFTHFEGTITVNSGASLVTGTGTLFSGVDRGGATVIAISGSSRINVGTVADMSPVGAYNNLQLPLVHPYPGTTLTNVSYELIDGPALHEDAAQSSVAGRFWALLNSNLGLVG